MALNLSKKSPKKCASIHLNGNFGNVTVISPSTSSNLRRHSSTKGNFISPLLLLKELKNILVNALLVTLSSISNFFMRRLHCRISRRSRMKTNSTNCWTERMIPSQSWSSSMKPGAPTANAFKGGFNGSRLIFDRRVSILRKSNAGRTMRRKAFALAMK